VPAGFGQSKLRYLNDMTVRVAVAARLALARLWDADSQSRAAGWSSCNKLSYRAVRGWLLGWRSLMQFRWISADLCVGCA
jgi:hypothetical protein